MSSDMKDDKSETKAKSKYPLQEEFEGSPSEDTSDRHPTDRELREAKFKIYSRRKDQEPVWERDGKYYKQSVAEFLARNPQGNPEGELGTPEE